MKFAFISHTLPPIWSGQAMVIHQLLENLDPANYCLISQHTSEARIEQNNYSAKLPGRYYHLPLDWQIPRGARFGVLALNILLAVWLRSRRIADILRRERCEAIVAASGDLYDLPAAYLASRLTGVAFYPYYFDYYSYQPFTRLERAWARRMEAIFLRGATGVIVPNESLRDRLRARYGIESVVIRNPCELSAYQALHREPLTPRANGDFRIVYTGAVYDAHFDAFRNLVAAIGLLERPDIKLHIYTAQPARDLAFHGISGPVVVHPHQAAADMPAIQRQAEILFLPLAFESPFGEIIKTSAPGKLGEYLAACQPILAHAPPDSFVALFLREHECGLVVGESDPAKLASALQQLASDENLRRTLCSNALAQARDKFDVTISRSRFAKLLRLQLRT